MKEELLEDAITILKELLNSGDEVKEIYWDVWYKLIKTLRKVYTE